MDGKAKESISLCGRALAVINAFIAMTSARAWRARDGGMDTQTAIRVMSADARFGYGYRQGAWPCAGGRTGKKLSVGKPEKSRSKWKRLFSPERKSKFNIYYYQK